MDFGSWNAVWRASCGGKVTESDANAIDCASSYPAAGAGQALVAIGLKELYEAELFATLDRALSGVAKPADRPSPMADPRLTGALGDFIFRGRP